MKMTKHAQNHGFIFLGHKPLLMNVSNITAPVVKLWAEAPLSSAQTKTTTTSSGNVNWGDIIMLRKDSQEDSS